ncbi:MAG: helix-turn-helix transcriptional regulator [Microbacterium sp.]
MEDTARCDGGLTASCGRPGGGCPGLGAPLSAREADVCELLLRGCENLEIAALLDISENTVRAHVSRVLAAHGVRASLLARAHWPDGACDITTLTGLTRLASAPSSGN